jgi:hypothetical protein
MKRKRRRKDGRKYEKSGGGGYELILLALDSVESYLGRSQ